MQASDPLKDYRSAIDEAAEVSSLLSSLQSKGQAAKSMAMSEIDAKITAAEARTDTKFAQLMGELRVISGRLDHLEKATSGIRMNIWLAAATALGLVVAIFGWGSQMFGVGMNAQSIADAAARQVEQRTVSRIDQLDTKFDNLSVQMNQVLQAIQGNQRSEVVPAPFQQDQ